MSSINRRDFGIAVVATMLLPVATARAEDLAVHIDNFVFEPAQLAVDQPGRHSPHCGVRRQVQVEDDGYRRHLLVHVRGTGRVQVFLFAASAYDRNDQG